MDMMERNKKGSKIITKPVYPYCCSICNKNVLNLPIVGPFGLCGFGRGFLPIYPLMTCPHCVKNIKRLYYVNCDGEKLQICKKCRDYYYMPSRILNQICYKNMVYTSQIYNHNDPQFCISMTFPDILNNFIDKSLLMMQMCFIKIYGNVLNNDIVNTLIYILSELIFQEKDTEEYYNKLKQMEE
jgi:hypothetical protein